MDEHGQRTGEHRPLSGWRNQLAVGLEEVPAASAILAWLEPIALLVDEHMVASAQSGQIGQCGWATIGPVPDVMSIDKAPVGAAGKLAAAVAMSQRPSQGR